MQLISDIGSERATNDSGKIITTATHTHVIWQDVSRESYFNRVRSLDYQTGPTECRTTPTPVGRPR